MGRKCDSGSRERRRIRTPSPPNSYVMPVTNEEQERGRRCSRQRRRKQSSKKEAKRSRSRQFRRRQTSWEETDSRRCESPARGSLTPSRPEEAHAEQEEEPRRNRRRHSANRSASREDSVDNLSPERQREWAYRRAEQALEQAKQDAGKKKHTSGGMMKVEEPAERQKEETEPEQAASTPGQAQPSTCLGSVSMGVTSKAPSPVVSEVTNMTGWTVPSLVRHWGEGEMYEAFNALSEKRDIVGSAILQLGRRLPEAKQERPMAQGAPPPPQHY